jgi:cytochrome c peroxidase
MAVRAATSLVLLTASVGAAVRASDHQPPAPPLGLPPVYWPDDNPYTPAMRELGWLLFFDRRLSSDGTVSCASCHRPEKAFTDGAAVSTGIGGRKGRRSAPSLVNRAYSVSQFWDGSAASLEEQVRRPLANPLEMTRHLDTAAAHQSCVERVASVPGYVQRFEQVFGPRSITMENIARAIATFERTILSGNAPYDRYEAGDPDALTPQQVRGMQVFFEKAQCDRCHIGFNSTDGAYLNTGIGMDQPTPDLGRYLVTKKEKDRGAFKVPTLREVEHTAPYMHDGSLATLGDVIEHYDRGGIKNPWLHPLMKPLHLTVQEKKDLVEFLKALSGEGWQQLKAPTARELPR